MHINEHVTNTCTSEVARAYQIMNKKCLRTVGSLIFLRQIITLNTHKKSTDTYRKQDKKKCNLKKSVDLFTPNNFLCLDYKYSQKCLIKEKPCSIVLREDYKFSSI